jgi:Tol biopolymer transport system component
MDRTSLSHFEILEPIGAGAMGEVFRARDTKLHREVALKVLPEGFSKDRERSERFEREARSLAQLNHPGIAAIHGIEEAEDVRFLVLELVPGETLADRLARGALPVEEALRACGEIADALAAAHASGIVHRDLKPANIKITPDGRSKVLDFGLAKAMGMEGAAVAGTLGAGATRTAAPLATTPGVMIGTPSYMSPEQVRGLPTDPRSDVWGLGCVMFETLSGRRPFSGATVADAIAAVLAQEPDWALLPADTPPAVRDLLARCLAKDVARRPQTAADVSREIRAILEARRAPRPVSRLSQVTFDEGVEEFPAWSPDGAEILYCRDVGGLRRLFRQPSSGGEAQRVTKGDYDEILPAWSPGGKTILYVRGRAPGRRLEPGDVFGEYIHTDVWSIDLASGREAKLIEGACNPSYSHDGTRIAVDAEWAGPCRIWIVDANGRNPRQATTDTSEAVVHLRPRWSPDGSMIVFQNVERTKFDIRLVRVPSAETVWITNDLSQDIEPCWSSTGRHIYFSSYRSGGINIWRVPVATDGTPAGPMEQVTSGAGQDVNAAISPDGSRLAFAILRQNADIWRLPVSPDTGTTAGSPEKVIATSREESRGSWSPEGERIAFNSDRSGDMNIWVHSLRDRSTRQLTRGPGGDFQPNWSPDGRSLAFFSSRSGGPSIWVVDVEGGEPRRMTDGGAIEINPFHSPDGRWIAYQSDRGGRLEVWVMGARGEEPRALTDVGVGGHFLCWSADSRWVIFRCPGRKAVLRVPVEGGEMEPIPEVAGGAHMSFSRDRSRIMDVVAHKVLWVSPLLGGAPEKVFEFEDRDARIDYPVWSPDGRWVLFDRFQPQGGDVWTLEGFE